MVDEFGRVLPEFLEQERQQPGYNAADPKHIEAARKEAGQRRREDADFWRIAMSTPQRRAALYRLLESCHIYGNAADTGSQHRLSDPYLTYLSLGREAVGKQIMVAAQDASLDLYLTMMKERKAAEDARERKHEKANVAG
jgi:hypothetical protein